MSTSSSRPPSPPTFQRLDPKNDLVFKLLFTRCPALLEDLIGGVLGRPVGRVTLLDADIAGDDVDDKAIILDVRAAGEDGSQFFNEMQLRLEESSGSRFVYYGSRGVTDQLGRGDGYERLKPTVVIVWLAEPMFPGRGHLHFELRDFHTGLVLSDRLAVHVLQLPALSAPGETGYPVDPRVRRWARFFMAKDDADYERLAEEDPIMQRAKDILDEISQDPDIQRRARDRAAARAFYEMDVQTALEKGLAKGLAQGLAEGRAEGEAKGLAQGRAEGEAKGRAEGEAKGLAQGEAKGRAEGEAKGRAQGEAKGRTEGEAKGRAEGRAELLLEQLGVRFGPLPAAVQARIEGATPAELGVWARRVLTGETLDDVLDP